MNLHPASSKTSLIFVKFFVTLSIGSVEIIPPIWNGNDAKVFTNEQIQRMIRAFGAGVGNDEGDEGKKVGLL